ncbi:MAG: hypothetical protein HW387_187 [Parachlamydiales bacterium]|nr:hypothetical protein [Parachlamydiales bacterium]
MRRKLLDQLVRWKEDKDRKPLILKGPRQVGKTTLLHQFGQKYFSAVHALNFEKDLGLEKIFESNLDPKHIIKELEFYLQRTIDTERDLLILDEIQACPRALTSLKYFAEEMPQLAVAAAGSLLGVYLGPASFPVGKVDIISLYPMSFEEFLLALDDHRSLELLRSINLHDRLPEMAHQHLFEQLKHYFIVGGLPESVKTFRDEKQNLFTAFNKVREKQNVLLDTYLADIAKHSGKVNSMHIARIWQSIPAQLARTQDGSGTKFKFKDVVPGIDRYNRLVGALDWLEAAKLIIKVPIVNSGEIPFSAHASETVFKLYLFDIGLLGAMSNLSPQVILNYDYGSYKGYFAENFIAQEFLARNFHGVYSWQERLAEVEFLYESNGKAIPIEVKSGWVTHAKSAKLFADKYHSPHRIIFSANNLTVFPDVHRYPLYLAGWLPT